MVSEGVFGPLRLFCLVCVRVCVCVWVCVGGCAGAVV
jgi:hypothetical protein